MAGKKSGLGRGLDALFPEKVSQEKPKTVRSSKPKTNTATVKTTLDQPAVKGETIVKISKVEPNREQPRKKFDEMRSLNCLNPSRCMEFCNHFLYLIRRIIMRSLRANGDGAQQRWLV